MLLCYGSGSVLLFGPRRKKACLLGLRILLLSELNISEILISFYLVFLAEQAGLGMTELRYSLL